MRPSKKWLRMAEVYKHFAKDNASCCLFDDRMALDCFLFESRGIGSLDLRPDSNGMYNGFFVGKHWLDVTLAMWKEDIRDGNLTKQELLEDPSFQHFRWFIEKVLERIA